MKTRLSLLIVLAVAALLAPLGAGAKKLKFKTCAQPLPLQLKPFTNQPQQIDSLCGNTGCFKNPANDLQNAQKNNFCASTDSNPPVTLNTFSALNNPSNNEPSIPKGDPPASRAKLAD